MNTMQYDRFLMTLQNPIAGHIGRQIRFKTSGSAIDCSITEKRNLLTLWRSLCASSLERLIFAAYLVRERRLWCELPNTFSFTVRVVRNYDNVDYSAEETVLSPSDCGLNVEQQLGKFSDYLADAVSEQEILEEEITSILRLNTVSTVLQYDLRLPDVIVVCLLQYFRNVTVTNTKSKTVVIN